MGFFSVTSMVGKGADERKILERFGNSCRLPKSFSVGHFIFASLNQIPLHRKNRIDTELKKGSKKLPVDIKR